MIINIQPFAWDSQFFNISIGKFEANSLTPFDFDELKKLKNKQGFDLIYLFLNEELEASNFPNAFLVDKKVVFQKIGFSSSHKQENSIEEFSGILTSELLELAIASGHRSRFKKDAILSSKFEELYRIWIEKSITGELADKIFISKKDNIMTGFVTIKKKSNFSQIGLIAVSEKYRGRGIGKKLLEKIDSWNHANGIEYCEVATQLDNEEACALYKKLNYSMKSVQYIYHL